MPSNTEVLSPVEEAAVSLAMQLQELEKAFAGLYAEAVLITNGR